MATTTTLVKDINPGPGISTSSEPAYARLNRSGSYFATLNNNLYFTANDGVHGTELWRTDGTEAGTTLIKDIEPDGSANPFWVIQYNNPDLSSMAESSSRIYFTADDSLHGNELWRTDGTEAGTVLIKDINPNGSSNIFWIAELNNSLYFNASDGVHGSELWKTDGTEAGTTLVKDIYPGGSANPSCLTEFKGYLYFAADDGIHRNAIWKTDGSDIGTVLVKTIGSGTSYTTTFYGKSIGWRSFGPGHLMASDNALYFTGGEQSSGMFSYSISHDIWKTNGTEADTVQLTSFSHSSIGVSGSPPNLTGPVLFKGDLYCGYGELWKISEAQTGKSLVKDINPRLRDPDSSFYSNRELDSNPSNFIVFNGGLYFTADDGTHGQELWKTDGTEAGTVLVKDINPTTQPEYSGSLPLDFAVLNGSLYFTANDGVHGHEIWKTDGTEAGTVLVADIFPGAASSDPSRLTAWNGNLYFWADDGVHGRELWKLSPNLTPTLSNLNKTGVSNQAIGFRWLEFTQQFSDIDANDHLTQIRITVLPTHGSLYLDRTPVALNQTISVQQIDRLIYVSNLNFVGTDCFSWNGMDMEDYATSNADVNLEIHSPRFFDLATRQFDLAGVLSTLKGDLSNFNAASFKTIRGTAQANILKGGKANDLIQGFSNTDHLWGRRRNDVLSGGTGNDYLNGGLASDLLLGGQGNDILVGGGGVHSNDVLVGGQGHDHLIGGKGHDYFGFCGLDKAVDQIVDFNHKVDHLLISASGFGGGLEAGDLASEQFSLGARSQDAMDRFLYHLRTGELLFDVDGIGGLKAIEVMHLTPNTVLTARNFVLV